MYFRSSFKITASARTVAAETLIIYWFTDTPISQGYPEKRYRSHKGANRQTRLKDAETGYHRGVTWYPNICTMNQLKQTAVQVNSSIERAEASTGAARLSCKWQQILYGFHNIDYAFSSGRERAHGEEPEKAMRERQRNEARILSKCRRLPPPKN